MKKFSIEIKWGIIFTLVMLLWMYFEKLMGWYSDKIDRHDTFTYFFAIPAFLIFTLALLDKSKHYYSGRINWIQGFFTGILISLVVAIISPLTQYISCRYISPEYFPNAIDHMVEIEKMTRHQAERYYTLGNFILEGVIGTLALGAVTSAIVAIFVRKK